MPTYDYRAVDGDGRVVSGRLEALNAVDLELRLARMNLDYVRGAAVKAGIRRHGVPRRHLINLLFQLEQLVRGGVPILDALNDLGTGAGAARLRAVLASMAESIDSGKTLSQAMAQHPHVFDDVACGLVRVGETSGRLPDVLAQLVAALKWQDEIAAHTKKLLLYPTILGAAALALLFFVMLYLVPKLAAFMTGMGQAVPMQTRVLLAVSGFLGGYWHTLLLVPAGAALAGVAFARFHPQGRYRLDAAKLKVPWLGQILNRIILARFSGAFAMMYASGITILDALRASEQVVGNALIARSLQRARQAISAGESVSVSFQDTGVFPPLVIRMLRIGENTGAMDTALANVSYFYSRDVREAVERAQTLIEPLLTLFIGALMAWIMLSIFGPIYDVIAGVKI